ncbi:MAG: type II secretion system major pseudopilin GspG [Candidatus Binataceae bacterium]
MKPKRHNQNGFTLIEIMVVIAIIGLLAMMIVPGIRHAMEKARCTKANADVAELKTALDQYYLDNGVYPTGDQGLAALQGTYIRSLPSDPWHEPYQYQCSDGNSYQISIPGSHC